jgi:hypothetical protein
LDVDWIVPRNPDKRDSLACAYGLERSCRPFRPDPHSVLHVQNEGIEASVGHGFHDVGVSREEPAGYGWLPPIPQHL